MDLAGQAVRVGVTTDEIDRIVHEACVERNCYPSPLNYYNFPKVGVCFLLQFRLLYISLSTLNIMTSPIAYLILHAPECVYKCE